MQVKEEDYYMKRSLLQFSAGLLHFLADKSELEVDVAAVAVFQYQWPLLGKSQYDLEIICPS